MEPNGDKGIGAASGVTTPQVCVLGPGAVLDLSSPNPLGSLLGLLPPHALIPAASRELA